MVRTASLFSQLLTHFPRTDFARLVRKHEAEKGSKGFDCWTQFVAMLFCQLAKADSLREICQGLTCCLGRLNHLGIKRAPSRSTLSYANRHRPAALYEDLFWTTLTRFRNQGQLGRRKAKFRFKNKLISLDATVISLCLDLFPWAKFRRAKGGIKVHIALDHDDYMPVFVNIAEAKVHEVKIARLLHLNPGSIVVMDRAYNDFSLFGRWSAQGVFFVTRLKSNTVYEVVRENRIPQNRNIILDQIIYLTEPKAVHDCPVALRRIVVWDKENLRRIVLLTNHLNFGASTIAEIYKDRWEIELFFKSLKQNLKIKTFIGVTRNALLIQIWTALIAMLLLKWLHFISQAGWSFSSLVSLLRMNLFTYRHLLDWINDPGATPPSVPRQVQLELPLSYSGQPA